MRILNEITQLGNGHHHEVERTPEYVHEPEAGRQLANDCLFFPFFLGQTLTAAVVGKTQLWIHKELAVETLRSSAQMCVQEKFVYRHTLLLSSCMITGIESSVFTITLERFYRM